MTTHRRLDSLKTVAFEGSRLTFQSDTGLETWERSQGSILLVNEEGRCPILDGEFTAQEVEDAFTCYLLGRGLRLEVSPLVDAFVAVEASQGWEVDEDGHGTAIVEVEGEWLYLSAHRTMFGVERFGTEAEARAYAAS